MSGSQSNISRCGKKKENTTHKKGAKSVNQNQPRIDTDGRISKQNTLKELLSLYFMCSKSKVRRGRYKKKNQVRFLKIKNYNA